MAGLIHGVCYFCGFELFNTEITSFQRDSIIVRAQLDIEMRIQSSKGCNEVLPHLSFIEYNKLVRASSHLLQGLPSFIDPHGINIEPFYIKSGGINNLKSAISIGNVFWMYQTQENLWRVLEQFNNKHHDIRYEQKKQFEKGLRNPALAHIKDWYDSFWIKKLDEGLVRSDLSVFKQSPTLLKNKEFLTKEELRHDMHITPAHMRNLQSHGFLKVRLVPRGKVTRCLIEADSLREALDEEKRYLTRKAAAKQLGIHPNSIPRLLQAALLQEQRSPRGALLITSHSVEELLHKCQGEFNESAEGILLHDALVKYSVNGLTLANLISWIVEGKIATKSRALNASLHDLSLNESELWSCLNRSKMMKKEINSYTIEDVRQILHVSERTVKDMIEKKFIHPARELIGQGGRQYYFFDKSTIDDLADSYIRIPRASEMYHIPEHKLRRWVRDGRLVNHTPGITRRALLKRNEIESLLSIEWCDPR